jgi:ketosteroid isomerase-like protein
MGSKEAFALFVSAINQHDVETLGALMAQEPVFVDSLGNRVVGVESIKAGWRGYFALCPDYSIRLERVIADGEVALAVGEAEGTIDGVGWRTPAAWKAVVRSEKVAEWHVFADNRPVYEILAKRKM